MAHAPTVHTAASERLVLDLSGPKLRLALERLIHGAEAAGGIERLATAARLKSLAFQERLGEGRVAGLQRTDFEELCALLATVRRRMPALIDELGWPAVRDAMVALLQDAKRPGTADARVAAFCAHLTVRKEAGGRASRFVRDLAAEILHNVLPEIYPLATRWVWDNRTNTGVLREIWHGEDLDGRIIDVPDTHETFLVLREELSQFLSEQGLFRDMPWYVDLLTAQIYAGYIDEQGGSYLKTEFGSEDRPIEHTRRILGLDGRGGRAGRGLDLAAAVEGTG
jgi:hypothetical protein